eukprot:TRINITY_DN8771_c0_g1_i1.p1 TRINITY_DN8771_c0_g1~~TRINITY_DN8771_c0_g1_i1.p1  ORF type:complete len:263 (+),score=39.28 TRINITY_DN8771_c0_g1_i1:87-875(+)
MKDKLQGSELKVKFDYKKLDIEDQGFGVFDKYTTHILDSILEKWYKPLNKHSIPQDLSRLISKIRVWDNDVLVLDYLATAERRDAIRSLIVCLGYKLGIKNLSYFEQQIKELYKEEQNYDVTKFYRQLIYDILGPDHKITNLLKVTCNQGMMFPPWNVLRERLLKDFPFKDMKGGWTIDIIFSMEKITVVHSKKERSLTEGADGSAHYTFTWQFAIVFDLTISKPVDVYLMISSLNIGALEVEKAIELEKILNTWKMHTLKY